jgi:hypothetical protein
VVSQTEWRESLRADVLLSVVGVFGDNIACIELTLDLQKGVSKGYYCISARRSLRSLPRHWTIVNGAILFSFCGRMAWSAMSR